MTFEPRSIGTMPGYQSNSPLERQALDAPWSKLPQTREQKNLPEPPRAAFAQAEVLASPARSTSLGASTATKPNAIVPPPLPLKAEEPLPSWAEAPISPGAVSIASTSMLPYNLPTPVNSPPLVPSRTFGMEQTLEQDSAKPATSARTNKFPALGFRKFSGRKDKEKEKELDSPTLDSPGEQPSSKGANGFKAFKFWQNKTDESDSNLQVAAATSLPLSPANSQHSEQSAPAQASVRPARIPRKSSLASLNASVRSGSPSVHQQPLSAASSSSMRPLSPPPQSPPPPPPSSEYRSPPTFNRSLPSGELSSSLAAPATQYSPYQYSNASLSPSMPASSGMAPSASMPSFRSKKAEDTILKKTPEMGSAPEGRFMGAAGQGGGVSSAPTTPAWAAPSVVSSSGRQGKPVKANAASKKFRLSESSSPICLDL